MGQLPWVLANVDQAWIFDNSDSELRVMAEKRDGSYYVYDKAFPEIAAAMQLAATRTHR